MKRWAALATLFAVLCGAAPAAGAVAPGKSIFPLRTPARYDGVDAAGLGAGLAQPDGSIAYVSVAKDQVSILRVSQTGALQSRITQPLPARTAPMYAQSQTTLPASDGGFYVVFAAGEAKTSFPVFRVARVDANGVLEPAYGDHGIATTRLQSSCGNCTPVTLQADGSMVLIGNTGSFGPPDPTKPADANLTAALTRLTPSGAVDAGFGDGGIATIDGRSGFNVATLTGDRLAVITQAGANRLQIVNGDGTANSAFNGGRPLVLPAGYTFFSGLRPVSGGGVILLASGYLSSQLQRYRPDGTLDQAFADRGAGLLPSGVNLTVLPTGDGGEIVAGVDAFQSFDAKPLTALFTRIASNGAITASAKVPLDFGGGYASHFALHLIPRSTPLTQSGFAGGTPTLRPDGSIVMSGAVAVIQGTGEGEGFISDQAALLAVGPDLKPLARFGGTLTPASITVSVPKQRAATAAKNLGVTVSARTSDVGLARITVKAGKVVVARSTPAAFKVGAQRLPVYLTAIGRKRLKTAKRLRVTVSATFRSLIGATARATAKGTLR